MCCSPWGRKESDRTEPLNNSHSGSRTESRDLVGLIFESPACSRSSSLPSPIMPLNIQVY